LWVSDNPSGQEDKLIGLYHMNKYFSTPIEAVSKILSHYLRRTRVGRTMRRFWTKNKYRPFF
jgi:hypothetical protein